MPQQPIETVETCHPVLPNVRYCIGIPLLWCDLPYDARVATASASSNKPRRDESIARVRLGGPVAELRALRNQFREQRREIIEEGAERVGEVAVDISGDGEARAGQCLMERGLRIG